MNARPPPHNEPPSLERIRGAARRISEKNGYRMAVLFGSLARGEAHPRDVDIAVAAHGLLDTVALTNELIRELHYQDVDLCDLTIADPVLLMLVAREGIPLYKRTPGEFDRFCSLAMRRFADTTKFREAERARIHDFIAGK